MRDSKSMLIGGAIVVGAILVFNDLNNQLWQKIKWSFDGLDFDGIGGDLQSIRLMASIGVDNKTSVDIPIEKFEGNINYLNKPLIPLKSAESTTIKANNKTVLRYSMSVNLEILKTIFGTSLTEIVTNFKSSLRPGNYRLIGETTLIVGGIVTKVPINEAFSFS